MREAIRDNLNGQLNKVSGLEVFSKEYIDFLVEDGESEIKVAHDLGISRMISGSYLAQGDRLRIEAHVVNVQTGLLEVSDSVEGAQADFFELQSELAFKIAGHLDFTLSPEDRTAIASTPSAPRLDAYRLLLEAEGETSQGESLEDQHLELPESPREDEAATELPSFLQWGWLGPRAAWAEETVSPETEIRRLLELYRRAYETKDLEMLGSVYIDLTPKQRGAREKYFQNTQDLEVEIHKVRIAVRGDEAVVSYTREDQFTDLQTGETVKLDVRLTKRLHRIDGGWKMAGRKK
jgi:TolB-like protein/ketosteroid isomerase-like protein